MSESIELKKFEDYLGENPPKGSTAPPRTVPARTLDKNFKKVTVIKDPAADAFNDRQYVCEYKEDGTILKFKPFPVGQLAGDIVYWDPEAKTSLGSRKFNGAWRVLSAVESEELHVLGIRGGRLQWVETEGC